MFIYFGKDYRHHFTHCTKNNLLISIIQIQNTVLISLAIEKVAGELINVFQCRISIDALICMYVCVGVLKIIEIFDHRFDNKGILNIGMLISIL